MSATHLSPPPPHLAFFASKAVPVVTMPSSALSSILAPVMANQDQSATLRAEPSVEEVSRVRRDETLKLSDRHRFLESSEHPERALPSPERPQTESPQKSLDLPEPSPASTTSSNVKFEVALVPPRRTTQSRTTIRRGKDVPRITTAKITGKVQRPTMTRKQTESKKPTFNIGSASSNGTKADGHGQHLTTAPPVEQHHARQTQHHSKPASLPKKGTTISTSSDYSPESDDDSEWASEGNSADEKEKNRQKLESKVRDAAQEAQRQRNMFSKLPKRSYTDLTQRTRSGLLSQLMNPDPSIFPPNHPYRESHSTTDMTQLTRQHGGQLPPPNYQTRESSAAVPLAAQIPPLNALAPSTNSAAASINAAYRPKGRPQGEELETDTEPEEEGAENGLQLSTSLVQRKLATHAGPSRRRSQDQQTNGPSGLARFKAPVQRRGTVPSVPVQTAPIPLTHSYNLESRARTTHDPWDNSSTEALDGAVGKYEEECVVGEAGPGPGAGGPAVG
ncbi:hypothetical protein BC629DRAFT_918923 [Irpex lacteus]|nr:hypothetical protein BC629DRAFT_918923 [Irpex lacteus]